MSQATYDWSVTEPPEVIVTVNGWLHDATPDEAHAAVCWPPHGPEGSC